jgi:hypothetical protein
VPALAGEHPDAKLLRLGDALKQAVARVEAFPSKQAWDAYGDAQAGAIEAIRSRGESLDDNVEELTAAVAPYQGAVDRDEELRRAADRNQDAIHKIAPRTVDGPCAPALLARSPVAAAMAAKEGMHNDNDGNHRPRFVHHR